jgi:hypothetical protein
MRLWLRSLLFPTNWLVKAVTGMSLQMKLRKLLKPKILMLLHGQLCLTMMNSWSRMPTTFSRTPNPVPLHPSKLHYGKGHQPYKRTSPLSQAPTREAARL